MPINYPRLDDATFKSLMDSTIEQLRKISPSWSGLSPSDPGLILLELFAYMTEELICRVNKLPEKTYVEFLKLLDATPAPPAPAWAYLTFSAKEEGSEAEIEIPERTKVTIAGGESGAPVFLTEERVRLRPSESGSVRVRAFNCEYVENEVQDERGTGEPGFVATVKNGPIVADPFGKLRTKVMVEARNPVGGEPVVAIGDDSYVLWTQCSSIGELNWTERCFLVENSSGRIRFPLKLYSWKDGGVAAERPGLSHAGMRIAVSYYRGGGSVGNVPAAALRRILDPDLESKLSVINEVPAQGGLDAETMEELVQRGPELIHSLKRLITAQDYTIDILNYPGIAQAAVYAKSEIWPFFPNGSVLVSLVPAIGAVPGERPDAMTDDTIRDSYLKARDENLLRQLSAHISAKVVLGVTNEYEWAELKPIGVEATVITYPLQSLEKVKREIEQRLYSYFDIKPRVIGNAFSLSVANTLNIAEIYTLIMGIKGVRHVRKLSLRLTRAPSEGVRSIQSCPYMPGYYIAAAEDGLYFSINEGDDWHLLYDANGRSMVVSNANTRRPGWFAAITEKSDGVAKLSSIIVTRDNGKTWHSWELAMSVYDCCWVELESTCLLLLATDGGLYSVDPGTDAHPALVAGENYSGGFYKVAAAYTSQKGVLIAAAAIDKAGLFIISLSLPNWKSIDVILKGRDIRALTIESDASRTWLWAGVTTAGDQDGEGCFKCELTSGTSIGESLVSYRDGWEGGSCRAILVDGSTVYAGSHRRGLLCLDTSSPQPRWQALGLESGLPLRDVERLFSPVNALEKGAKGIIVGTDAGIYAGGAGKSFKLLSSTSRYSNITIPKNWFFCSGKHNVIMEEFHEG
jgi:hypothetical protein